MFKSPFPHGFQRRAFFAALVFFTVFSSLFAGGNKEAPAKSSLGAKVVIASTSWTAAIAQAGGAENVRILAPLDLRHPPEYELKPSDLAAASKADIIIYAGWEQFAKRLAETAGSAGVQTIAVTTVNTPEDLRVEAEKIARILGTEDRFNVWWNNFEPLAADLREKIRAAYPDPRAAVQRMQTPFAQWLGLDIIGEYGPAEPSPAVILELVRTKPGLVIDNYHGPSGQPIAEASGALYAELLNFPGKDGTRTIDDVFRYNADVLIKAASSK